MSHYEKLTALIHSICTNIQQSYQIHFYKPLHKNEISTHLLIGTLFEVTETEPFFDSLQYPVRIIKICSCILYADRSS